MWVDSLCAAILRWNGRARLGFSAYTNSENALPGAHPDGETKCSRDVWWSGQRGATYSIQRDQRAKAAGPIAPATERGDLPCLEGAEAQKLPPVLRWSKYFAHRHLDDAAG